MSQDQLIILLLKIGLIAGLVSIALWACVYTRLARWWQNPVGRTLVTSCSTPLSAAAWLNWPA